MVEHPNAVQARMAVASVVAGDVGTFVQSFSPTCTWRIPGSNPLAGVQHGHEGIQNFFARVFERTNQTFKVELEDVLASDQHVVLFLRLTADAPGGPVDTRVAHFATVDADGKFDQNWWLASDLAMSDRAMN